MNTMAHVYIDCRVIISPLDWVVRCIAISNFITVLVRDATAAGRILWVSRRIRTLLAKSLANSPSCCSKTVFKDNSNVAPRQGYDELRWFVADHLPHSFDPLSRSSFPTARAY